MKNRTMISTVLFALSMLLAAGDLLAQPEFRSDVQKEYDEHGNLKKYDSCWSWSYLWGSGPDFDSIMAQFFRQHSMSFDSDHSPFHRDSARDSGSHFKFPDSLEFPEDFHFPEHFDFPDNFGFPENFDFYGYFDSLFLKPYPESFLDPEQFRSFFEDLPFPEFHFPDIQLPDFSFPHDSLDQFNPDWQDFRSPPPWKEKKSARGIEI